MNDLSALLLHGREWEEISLWCQARFFLKFSLGCCGKIFVWFNFSFGDRPRPVILVFEERATWMGKQDSKFALVDAVHEEASDDFGHGEITT